MEAREEEMERKSITDIIVLLTFLSVAPVWNVFTLHEEPGACLV